jgi:hypothetical protein
MGEPQAAIEFFLKGQSDLQIARLDVAPLKFEMAALNLKRAINFYKFKKKKKFYMQIAELDWGCLKIQIEIERRKRGGGGGAGQP